MIKKNICLAFFALLISGMCLQAQGSTSESEYVAKNHFEAVFDRGNFKDVNYAYVEGSAYIHDEYQQAVIIYKGKKLGEFPVRYNGFLDQMETPNEKGGIGALRKADDLSVKFNGEHYKLLNYKDKSGDVEQAYFVERIADENCAMYQRKYKTLREGEEAKTSFHQGSTSKFLDQNDYYVKFGEEALQKVKLKKSKVLGVFPKHNDQLKTFVKERKLDLSTENGLKQLVIYYNTLGKVSS